MAGRNRTPYPLERDFGATRRALEHYHIIASLARRPAPWLFRSPVDRRTRDAMARILRLERRMRQNPGGTLVALATTLTKPERNEPRSHYRIAAAALCRRRGLLSRIAPFLFPRADRRGNATSMLGRLAKNAHTSRRQLRLLEASWRHARLTVSSTGKTTLRQGAAIPRLIDLLYTVEALRPRWAAKVLGVSESQLGRMLSRLAEFGLVRELTGRGSYQLWAPPDAEGVARGRPAISQNPSPALFQTLDSYATMSRRRSAGHEPLPEIDWSSVFDEVDEAIHKLQRELGGQE